MAGFHVPVPSWQWSCIMPQQVQKVHYKKKVLTRTVATFVLPLENLLSILHDGHVCQEAETCLPRRYSHGSRQCSTSTQHWHFTRPVMCLRGAYRWPGTPPSWAPPLSPERAVQKRNATCLRMRYASLPSINSVDSTLVNLWTVR
jgi:hypothetical protein